MLKSFLGSSFVHVGEDVTSLETLEFLTVCKCAVKTENPGGKVGS